MKVSVVVPIYKCNATLEELTDRLIKTLDEISDDYEIILVNDASPENDWKTITSLSEKYIKVKGLNFSRNFGQHCAITAGLEYSIGEWVIVMDGDLQDVPEEITNFYKKAQAGYDIILGRRINRQDTFLKKSLSKTYYVILSYLTNTKIDYRVGTFRMLSRNVVDQFTKMKEYSRFFGAMISWLGFNVAYIDIEHVERNDKKSSYTLRKKINLAIDGILLFSDTPLKLTIKLGVLITIISGMFIIYKVILALTSDTFATGWSSLIASIFFSTGIIISVLGVIGLYIGRIFEQVKQRPLYIIQEKTRNI